MPKHKKTRDSKKLADMRKLASSQPQHVHVSPTYSFTTSSSFTAVHTSEIATKHKDTTILVKKDLQKTAYVSFAIVILQLLFYFLLTHHILAIGFARY